MNNPLNHPVFVFLLSFFVLWLSARIGGAYLRRWRKPEEDIREDLGVIMATTLTLLGLIIGFSFSMGIGRYDQRKNYEEAEANAIGTFVAHGLPGSRSRKWSHAQYQRQ